MIISEVNVTNVVEISEHGHSYVNPYYGCTAGCPFCYWLSIPGWEGKVDVRLNIAEQLDKYCSENKDSIKRIYFGSYCDPYMDEYERKYELMRECLKVLKKHDIPTTLCTSSRSLLPLRDLDLFRTMNDFIFVPELCRFDQLDALASGGIHYGIEVANEVHKYGVKVIATLAPICPGVMDVQAVRTRLNPEIPMYLDYPYVVPNTIQEERVLDVIQRRAPELVSKYKAFFEGTGNEFRDYIDSFVGKDNIHMLPFD